MDDKFKILGIGVGIGIIAAFILFRLLGAQPTEVGVGPVKFQIPTTESESVSVSVSTSSPIADSYATCSFVTVTQIDELKNIQDVALAIKQVEQFSGYKQNDYQEGDLIPANVLIATDLRSTNLEQFGVMPINNQGGWGLFVTTRQISAPNAGTYWCIK